MPLFLSAAEREGILRSAHPLVQDYRWALDRRCAKRARNPGLITPDTTTEWWYCCAEYVFDAAMVHAVHPDPAVDVWLRGVVLDLARRGEDDWVGPWFRDHGPKPAVGHLETAHLAWALTLALDLAADLFTPAEQDELRAVLRERAIPMCLRYLEVTPRFDNWRCVLVAGAALPAALLDDRAVLERCAVEWRRCSLAFQGDGSHGESLQYSHYAMYGLMLAHEALVRRDAAFAARLDAARYGRGMRWHAASLLYRKPLGGAWGEHPRPRAVNFNDSGTHFAPSPEVLLHIALRCRDSLPVETALARWICEAFWSPAPDVGPHDRATFGLLTDWTGLVLPFLGRLDELRPARSPAACGLERLQAFSCGDVIARDAWDGRTILATRGGGDLLSVHGHLHGDLNSFILAHNGERLIADPGHSCYRNRIHGLDVATRSHSTCTFRVESTWNAGSYPRSGREEMEQDSALPKRFVVDDGLTPPTDRGARRLIAADDGPLVVIGSEVAGVYGPPLRRFARFWLLAGTHVVFVVDHIVADEPVRTTWNWILNNRGDALDIKPFGDRLVVRRGAAGMKLFHLGGARTPVYAHGWMHEAYHPLPGQLGEGANGSARIVTWVEPTPRSERWAVHAIALDGVGGIPFWHLCQEDGQAAVLESPGGRARWTLAIDGAAGDLTVRERIGGASWRLRTSGACVLERV